MSTHGRPARRGRGSAGPGGGPPTVPWDWEAEARAAGISRDRIFNAATIGLPKRRALVWWCADGTVQTYSGAQVRHHAGELAAALAALGVRRGDRVAGLLSRRPEAFCTALAAWTLGAIYVPLFTGFSGDGLRVRLADCGPAAIVTDPTAVGSLEALDKDLAGIEILVVGGPAPEGAASFDALRPRLGTPPAPVATGMDETSTIMYTSGTTGPPKGCMIPHRGILSLLPYTRHCLALSAGDILFSGADAGWSFGLYTSGLGPMSQGVTRVIYEGPFDVGGWWECVRRLGAGHVAAAPTAFRQLAAAGADLVPPQFTAGTSAGEPLDAPTVQWFIDVAGVELHDSYGLSELGMVAANLRQPSGGEVVAGSMGVPLPGFELALLDDDGRSVGDEEPGRIAVRDNGFFLGNGYWGRQQEWRDRFVDGWFLTEDLARRDAQGRYWYIGRADDMIVTAGYTVSPAEVESALVAHPRVVDAACVAVPDPLKGHVVGAHVVLADPPRSGQADRPRPDADELLGELRRWVGERVGWHAAPRRVYVRDDLPRTASGKVQRHLLRQAAAEAG